MWISLKNSFIALCRDEDHPDELCVRARRARDITAIFPDADVIPTPRNDYQFRSYIPEDEVANALAIEIKGVNYRRFKPECRDRALHDSYMNTWNAMLGIQEQGSGGIYNH